MAQHQGSITGAILWMFFLSIALFWMPLLGPFIAGFVGGRKAGNTGSAVLAVLVPALVLGGMVMLFSTALLGMPIFGMLAGFGTVLLALIHVGPMFVGALLGGATA